MRRQYLSKKFLLSKIVCNSLCFIAVAIVLMPSTAFAEVGVFIGGADNMIKMLQGMVRLARIVMMFVAALLGIICGVMWYTGQQQAQGMLQKFFVAVFFIFGATAILDAILGMTVGGVTYDGDGTERFIENAQSECNWTSSEETDGC